MLKNISALAPAKSQGRLNVTEMQIRNNSVRIDGYCDQNEMVESFRKSLEPLSTGEVRFSSLKNLDKDAYKGFSISFQVAPNLATGSM